ncbi:hypothetical protein HZS_418 [Henneguya salminicola]|nr:hypothetical protein HZS_418 [Henneguya salminicola]
MCIVFLTEIVHEIGHVLAAYVEDIKVCCTSHTIYVGFIPFSKTYYILESNQIRSHMSYMRLFTAGVTNNLLCVLVAYLLNKITSVNLIKDFLRLIISVNTISAFCNSLPFPDHDVRISYFAIT